MTHLIHKNDITFMRKDFRYQFNFIFFRLNRMQIKSQYPKDLIMALLTLQKEKQQQVDT